MTIEGCVLVNCDWAQTEEEQKIMREITDKFYELRNLTKANLYVNVKRYGEILPERLVPNLTASDRFSGKAQIK